MQQGHLVECASAPRSSSSGDEEDESSTPPADGLFRREEELVGDGLWPRPLEPDLCDCGCPLKGLSSSTNSRSCVVSPVTEGGQQTNDMKQKNKTTF